MSAVSPTRCTELRVNPSVVLLVALVRYLDDSVCPDIPQHRTAFDVRIHDQLSVRPVHGPDLFAGLFLSEPEHT
jgi:hypothetical protein